MPGGKRLDHSQLIPRFRVEFIIRDLPGEMRSKAILQSREVFDCTRGTLWRLRFYPYDKPKTDRYDWYPKLDTLMRVAKYFNCKVDDLINSQKERLYPDKKPTPVLNNSEVDLFSTIKEF